MVSYDVWYFYSGCRADANEAAIILLPCNITVFTLDFSGSGLSDGNYVSLGWNEVGWSLVTVWKCSTSSPLFFVLSLFLVVLLLYVYILRNTVFSLLNPMTRFAYFLELSQQSSSRDLWGKWNI